MSAAVNMVLWTLLYGSILAYGQQLDCKRPESELGQEEDSTLLQTKIVNNYVDNVPAAPLQEKYLHAQPSGAANRSINQSRSHLSLRTFAQTILHERTISLKVATRTDWPSFGSVDELKQDHKWHTYLEAVYGPSVDDPSVFPINVSTFWVLNTDHLADAGLEVASSLPECPHQHFDAFSEWNHTPAKTIWIFQPPPFVGLPNNTRVEVTHSIPIEYGRQMHAWERQQYWMYYARGSGIFYNLGRTRVYQHHSDVVREFLPANHTCRSTTEVADCVAFAMSYASKFYDSLQFLGHADQFCSFRVPKVVPFEIVDLKHSGNFPCDLKVDGGLGEARTPCNCNKTNNFLNCDFGFKLAENAPSLVSQSALKAHLRHPRWHVIAITVVLLMLLSSILVRALYYRHHSPITMAALSCAFFGIDNFLIAYAGAYLHLPNAHMALMFLFIGFVALALHIILVLQSETYKMQMRAMLCSTKMILACIALTAIFVDIAEVCSNIGFSMDLPSSGPYQALASCNVLIVCPFFYYFYGESLTRLQLCGMSLLIIGATFLSDMTQWGRHSISLRGFLWLMLSMLFYSMSDITLRFTSIVGLAWQPRVMFMLFVMAACSFPMYAIDREENGFMEYYQSPSLLLWPILNAIAGILGLLSCTIAFEAPEAPCGVLSAIVNASCGVLVILNKVILGYSPSASKIVGMGFIVAGMSVFHVVDTLGSCAEDDESCSKS